MELSDAGVAFLARWEGKRNSLYNDSKNHCTIGIGHLVHMGPCDGSEPDEFKRGLSDDEVWDLFRTDVAVYVEAVNRLVAVPLTQERFDRLVSFAFNWGIGNVGGFPATSILERVNAEDWASVADELVNGRGPITTQYPSGRRYDKDDAGVRARRVEEAAVFRMTPVQIVRAVIADLEAAGIPVQEIAGWEDRGRPYAFNPRGAVDHHTATRGYQYDYPSLGIVRDGRSDLPGPLSNFGIGRITGTVYVIAGGFCNHAGGGGWNGLRGNGSVWGASEAENDGIGEPVSPEQMKARLHLHAALCRHTGYGPEMIACHREWSDGGKIDPTGVDGDWLRDAVYNLLNATPEPEPEPDTEAPELFIFDYFEGDKHKGILYSDGFYYWGVTGETLAFYNTGKVPHLGAKGEAFMADLTFREKRNAPKVENAQDPQSATDLVDINGCVTLFGPVEALTTSQGGG